MRGSGRVIVTALAALAAACGSSPKGPRVPVVIPAGATLESATDSLVAHGVLRSAGAFRLYARLRGLPAALKSGDYMLPRDAAWSDLIATLSRGHGIEVRWTVPEGLMLWEVADLAQSELGVSSDSFLAAARDPVIRRDAGVPPEAPSVEGYLFPTTYVVPAHVGARELVRVMTRAFAAHWDSAWTNRLDTLRLSRHQLVTLASIVEAEVRYDPDRPFVAAVYLNRFRQGMKLEADPTVIYAYGRRLKRVWDKNLLVSSPYNTYLHVGLPPGPIGEPGRASLLAALYPAPLPFLYFVAQPDGKHIFSTTYAEHEAAIQTVKRQRAEARAPQPRGR